MTYWITVAGGPAATGVYSPMPCTFPKDGVGAIAATAGIDATTNGRYNFRAMQIR